MWTRSHQEGCTFDLFEADFLCLFLLNLYTLHLEGLEYSHLQNIQQLCLCTPVPWPVREGNGTPLQYSCLENPMDRGAWWAAAHGVAESRTRLNDFTFTFHFQALEKDMATHSSVLAWRIPGTGEPGGLLSMGSHRVGHDWSNLAAAERMVCGLPGSKVVNRTCLTYIYIFFFF